MRSSSLLWVLIWSWWQASTIVATRRLTRGIISRFKNEAEAKSDAYSASDQNTSAVAEKANNNATMNVEGQNLIGRWENSDGEWVPSPAPVAYTVATGNAGGHSGYENLLVPAPIKKLRHHVRVGQQYGNKNSLPIEMNHRFKSEERREGFDPDEEEPPAAAPEKETEIEKKERHQQMQDYLNDPSQKEKAKYRQAKYRNFHKMYHRHADFFQAVMAKPDARIAFFTGLTLILLGPFAMYFAAWNFFMWLTKPYRKLSKFADVAFKSLKSLVILLCVAVMGDLGIRSMNFQENRWIQVDLESTLSKVCVIIFGFSLIRLLGAVHHHLEEVLLNKTVTSEYHTRREFMAKLGSPSNIEPVQDQVNTQEEIIFKQIWMPFYAVSSAAICVATCLRVGGHSMDIYMIAGLYFFFMLIGAVFGAHTVGPDIYGGTVLLFEKPFQVGDIISLEDKGGAGGCRETLCTGFVERISLRSTAIRRFDMRLCIVPNSTMFKAMVANWARPRKLIHLDFAISHRCTVAVATRFSQEARAIIKNHPDVDQALYTKAVINALQSGYNFRVICFNNPDTKKQLVQEDIIFRISSLARRLGIEITFQEQSLSVSREQIAQHYLQDSEVAADADVQDIVPAKKERTSVMKTAPDSYLLIKIEKVLGNVGFVSVLENCSLAGGGTPLFVRVTHDPTESSGRSNDTENHMLQPNMNSVFLGETLEFKFADHEGMIAPWARIELFAKTGKNWRQTTKIAQATIELPELMKDNTNYSTIVLKPALEKKMFEKKVSRDKLDATANFEASVRVKVFLGKDLEYDSCKSTGSLVLEVNPRGDGAD